MSPAIEQQRWIYARVRSWLRQVRRARDRRQAGQLAGLGFSPAASSIATTSSMIAPGISAAAAVATISQPDYAGH